MHLCYTNLNWFSYSIAQSQIAVNVISSNNIYTLSNWRWRPCPCLHVSQQSIIFSTCVCLVLFTLSRYQTICIQDTMWSSLYCMVMPDLKWSHKSRKCYLISQNIMLMLKCNHLLACSSTHNCRYLLQKTPQKTPPISNLNICPPLCWITGAQGDAEGFVGRVWHQASGYLMWFQRQWSTRALSHSTGYRRAQHQPLPAFIHSL